MTDKAWERHGKPVKEVKDSCFHQLDNEGHSHEARRSSRSNPDSSGCSHQTCQYLMLLTRELKKRGTGAK